MYLIRKAIVALFVVLFAAPLHAEGDTESLRIALIPKKGIEELISEYQPLIAYLSDELGMPVEVVPTQGGRRIRRQRAGGPVSAIATHGTRYLRVLWRSEPIHYDPFVFSGGLSPTLKRRVSGAGDADYERLRRYIAR